MLIISGTLLMFTGAAMGLLWTGPNCTFSQSDPCYGAVGHPLYLQLMPEFDLILKKGNGRTPERILRFRNNTVTLNQAYRARWTFITVNSTMIINSVERSDSGRYFLENCDEKGDDKGIYFLQLITEAVVSSVEVTDSCFSTEKRRVSCSSDGEQLRFSWALSGFTLGHQLTDGNQTLLLDKDDAGNVTCYVVNHVSHEHIITELQECPGFRRVAPAYTFNQSGPCFGVVGHPLYLQLVSKEHEMTLKKTINESVSKPITKFKSSPIRLSSNPRWQFVTENRTIIISRAEKNDSGNYTLDTFDLKGNNRGIYTFQLIIEAVVSSVEVIDDCFSSKKRRVSCSTDGDQLRFRWTLSGFTFGHRPTDGNQTLLLDKDDAGNVTCYVENNFSRGKKTTEIYPCPVSPSAKALLSVGVLEIITLLLLLAGFHIYARFHSKWLINQNQGPEKKNQEMEETLESNSEEDEMDSIFSEGV